MLFCMFYCHEKINYLEKEKVCIHISFKGWITIRPLWPGHFGQNDTLDRVTFWPRTLWLETVWPERKFGQGHFGQSDTKASFSSFLWGTKGWKKIHRGNHREKFEKNNQHFSEKKYQLWPKCHQPKRHMPNCLSGQMSLGKISLA